MTDFKSPDTEGKEWRDSTRSRDKGEERMDEIDKDILRTVHEHNEKGEEIYLRTLTSLFGKRISKTTLHRRVRQLVDDGELVEKLTAGKRSTRKCLYMPADDNGKADIDMIWEMDRKLDMILSFFGISHEICDTIRRQRRR